MVFIAHGFLPSIYLGFELTLLLLSVLNCYMLVFVAASGNPCSSRTKVGSKRNWKIANEKSVVHATAPTSSALTSPAEKGTSRHSLNLGDHLSSGRFINMCLLYRIMNLWYWSLSEAKCECWF